MSPRAPETRVARGGSQKLAVRVDQADGRRTSHSQRRTSSREETDVAKLGGPGDGDAGFPCGQAPRRTDHVIVDHQKVGTAGHQNSDIPIGSSAARSEAEPQRPSRNPTRGQTGAELACLFGANVVDLELCPGRTFTDGAAIHDAVAILTRSVHDEDSRLAATQCTVTDQRLQATRQKSRSVGRNDGGGSDFPRRHPIPPGTATSSDHGLQSESAGHTVSLKFEHLPAHAPAKRRAEAG